MKMRGETKDILKKGARELGMELSPHQLAQVDLYMSVLLEQGRLVNLTSITREEEVAVRHFIDSWTCCRFVGERGRLIDVGTGAGFPGLPIKIIRPGLEVTLLEATAKKAAFLSRVVKALGLDGVRVATARAEEEGRREESRERYDYATARAVGPLALVVELCLPLLKVGGILVAQRGEQGEREAQEAEKGLGQMGGSLLLVVPVEPHTGADNYLVVMEKTRPTPEKYPRRNGIPEKRPLW